MTASASDRAPTSIPADGLVALAAPEVQKTAARSAQDAFARVFRITVTEDEAGRARGVAELATALGNWSRAGAGGDAQALRLAMVMAGLDQWGLAYSQAFALQAIPGLTELLGTLRTGLDPQAEARLTQQFVAIEAGEGNAIDFKVDLRRGIHLALWHAMIAAEEREQATAILTCLGGMLIALVETMPELGWRLVADALAHIQIQCVAEGLASEGLAQETTQTLFGALSSQLSPDVRDRIMAHAGRAVIAWQQAARSGSTRPS